MARYVKTEEGYQEIEAIKSKFGPFKPAGKSYLTFSSPSSFTLKVNDATKHWDGTLEYFASDKTWTVWDGTTTLSAVADDGEYVLYLRGTGNTVITGSNSNSNYKWVLTGTDIKCIGNIENLLDYATVASGEHPTMASYCYNSMFYGCTSLTQVPELPAMTLATYCYSFMFRDCTSLTQAPALPATTLANSCYYSMFYGCTSLTQAPALPATTLATYCYYYMFRGCTALTQAPALPATMLKSWCYSYMFQDCTALTQAPALPATTLADSCYSFMFCGCTGLTQAPALPATTLVQGCYYGMFSGCTSLTQAPALPATTLADHCYHDMFHGCISLKLSTTQSDEYTQEYRIPSSGEGITPSNGLSDMFTSTGGTFKETPTLNTTYYLSSDNMIVRETGVATLNGYVWSMIDVAIAEHTSNPLNITGATVGQIAKITAVDDSGKPTSWEAVDDRLPNASPSDAGKALAVEQTGEFEYGYGFTDIPKMYDFINLDIDGASPGQLVKVKYVDDTGKPTAWEPVDMPISFKPAGRSYLTFSSLNSFTLAVGDATKHWDGTLEYFASDKTWTTWDGTTTLSSVDNDGEYVLYLRGTGNTVITGSSANYRWILTGIDIKCIGNIENLLDYATVQSGIHPTMASNCYRSMFKGCTGLIQAPALPATTLADSCYSGMFYGCTSLTKAPALPATTLANYCYMVMFYGCTSLAQAPALPATMLADHCYYCMFQGCTSLTQAPELPATTLAPNCYYSMFQGCTSLTQAPALPATTLANYCYYCMFQNCTALTQAPALPATTLANYCYRSMFQGCTGLTQAPALPATTLASVCYMSMFLGCTSLKLSSTKTGEYTQEYRIPSFGDGVAATDALADMFTSTGGTFAGTPSINTTYYLSSDNMIVRESDIATLNGYVGSMIAAKAVAYPSAEDSTF